jgi:Putative Ig domain
MIALTRLAAISRLSSFLVWTLLLSLFATTPNLFAQGGPLRIQTSGLPPGTVGTPYSFTMDGAGGTPPYTWSASGLPSPLTINSSTGQITGTPAAAGQFTVTVTIRDTTPTQPVSKAFPLTISGGTPPLSITTTSLPGGVVNTAYSATLAATGGTAPYTWSLISGSLPAGLTLSPTGTITGTPTTAVVSNFTVQVADSAAQTASKALSITINPAAGPPPTITTASPLPAGTILVPYSQTLAASGGTPPYTWSLASGTLPAGLTLSPAGVISGIPTSAGTANFVVQVADSASQTATKSFSLTIGGVLLSITTASPLPSGSNGAAYSQTLTASGGTPPYTWSVTSGALPAGLTLSSGGVISGTPSTTGTANFTVQVADSLSQNATKAFSLTISAPTLSITSSSPLAAGTVGTAYSQNLTASGGTPPFTWSVQSGTLPAGITLSTAGVLSGTPTSAGTSNFTVRVADSGSQIATKAFSITISPAPLLITTTSPLPAGTVGTAYSQNLEATGGTSPYTWSVASGPLPAGLTLSQGGTFSGTPANAGTFGFTIQVRDGAGVTSSKAFSLTVLTALSITTTSPLPSAAVNVPYSVQIEASTTDPLTWSVTSGNLPPGLTLSSSGLLSGTPTSLGGFDFTIQARRAATDQTATKQFRLDVVSGLTITTATLPNGAVSAPYTATLNAAGGVSPYSWSVTTGALPDGLALANSGTISGTPTRASSFTFTVQVSDNSSQRTSKVFSITISSTSFGSLSLTSVPTAIDPAQQVVIGLSISTPQPSATAGTLIISFASSSVVSGDDPFVLLSNGSRTADFTIPANSTAAVFSPAVSLLTGTVSGTVTFRADIRNGPTGLSVGSVTIRATAPRLTNTTAVRVSSGIRIQVTGFSPDRTVTNAQFGFDVKTTTGSQRVDLSRSVQSEFDTWYRSASSVTFGSSFMFEQLFTVQGDAGMIDSVTVGLTNSQGSGSSTAVKVTAN